MTKEEIMNTYAIEQGYEIWRELAMAHVVDFDGVLTYEDLIKHQNAVIQIVQEELLKKVTDEITKNKNNWIMSWKEIRKEILNTEIL